MVRLLATVLALFFLAASAAGDSATAKPTLISLDYCADQYVLALADRDQILAVSPKATSSSSYYRDRAAGLPQTSLSAEEILALNPDLVVRSYGGSYRDLGFYKRFGIGVIEITGDQNGDWVPEFSEIEQEILTVGAALGQSQRAERLAARLSYQAEPFSRDALYFTASGAVAGENTLVGEILARSGVDNAAGAGGWTILPLEDLYLSPPEFALTAFFEFDAERTTHWSSGRHPLMQRMLAEMQHLPLREDRITCPAWLAADEARDLSNRLRELEE